MKLEDRVILRFSIAVSLRCTAQDHPISEHPSPEEAAGYIHSVLELLFSKTGLEACVEPLAYPAGGKVPLIIHLGSGSECLFWFYPHMETGKLAVQLEESLQDLFSSAVSVPA